MQQSTTFNVGDKVLVARYDGIIQSFKDYVGRTGMVTAVFENAGIDGDMRSVPLYELDTTADLRWYGQELKLISPSTIEFTEADMLL